MAPRINRPPPSRRHEVHYCPCSSSEVMALKALYRGEADSIQQQRALKWIADIACGSGTTTTYRPGNGFDTVFMVGRRFVADHINLECKRTPEWIAMLVEEEAKAEAERRQAPRSFNLREGG